MEKFWEHFIKLVAAAGGMIAGALGSWTMGSRVLVILMVVDYLTGLGCALTGHSTKPESGHFWSQVAFMGLLKKALIMAVILVAALLDAAVGGANASGAAGGGMTMFRSAAEFFYIASEALSIVENAGLMGVPVPRRLKQALEALRDKNDGDDE